MLSFCLFAFPLRIIRQVILSAGDWVYIFVLFVVQMRCPAGVLLVAG